MQILDRRQEELLRNERRILNDLQLVLESFGPKEEDREALQQSIQQLDDFFLIVVVGEFNSGKSALINAFLGRRILEEGVTPTTTKIYLLRYGEIEEQKSISNHQVLLTSPIEILSNLSIVDTPGTNTIIREHEILTSQFIPRSDLVLFITSADRPLTESERTFLENIRQWGKKIIFVVNKIDILKNDQERIEIENFIQENARSYLGDIPVIFAVSAREALQAKQGANDGLWQKSRFAALEQYINSTLDEEERFRLKLLNPLGVGIRLASKYLEEISARLNVLKTDIDLVDDLERQLNLYREDMHHHFSSRLAEIENYLFEMENRGHLFFDETFRLGRIFDLLSKQRVQQEFERLVVADTPSLIEAKVSEIIHWVVDANLRQWEAVAKHLRQRSQEHQGPILGDLEMSPFDHDRQNFLQAALRETRRAVETYDRTREAKDIADSAQTAVAASAALEVGAIGLGALITTIATTAAADVTGVIMASFMATLGFFIIPAKRRQGKTKLMEKIAKVRTQLIQSIQNQFRQEIDRSLDRIKETVGPYTRFIRSEQSKMIKIQADLHHLAEEMVRIKKELEEKY